jgi:hypothetical protein
VLVHFVVIFLPQSLANESSLLLSELILSRVGIGGCDDHSLQMLGVLSSLLHDIFGLGITSASALYQVWLAGGTEGRHSFEASN